MKVGADVGQQPALIKEGKDLVHGDHEITEPYIDQDYPMVKGVFQGKFIMKKKKGDESKGSVGQLSPKSSEPLIEKEDQIKKESQVISFSKEMIVQLLNYKFVFGHVNFFNIFHCFYMLSNVSDKA